MIVSFPERPAAGPDKIAAWNAWFPDYAQPVGRGSLPPVEVALPDVLFEFKTQPLRHQLRAWLDGRDAQAFAHFEEIGRAHV